MEKDSDKEPISYEWLALNAFQTHLNPELIEEINDVGIIVPPLELKTPSFEQMGLEKGKKLVANDELLLAQRQLQMQRRNPPRGGYYRRRNIRGPYAQKPIVPRTKFRRKTWKNFFKDHVKELVLSETNMEKKPRQKQNQTSKQPSLKVPSGYTTYVGERAGGLVTWGKGLDGQLGNGKQDDSPEPVRIQGLEHAGMVMVRCGKAHTAVLAENGDVYTFGYGARGQLGHRNWATVPRPSIVQSIKGVNVRSISCGDAFTVALTDAGQVWSWGQGQSGQLGHGNLLCYTAPTPVEALMALKPASITMIACGARHVVSVTDTGNAYTWGDNEQGQLGLGTSTPQWLPKLVRKLHAKGISHVSAGGLHSGVIAENGLYTWGGNSDGQLGIGHYNNARSPQLVKRLSHTADHRKVTTIESGHNHTVALMSDGTAWSWGSNRFAQLGHGDTRAQRCNTPKPISVDKNFVKVAAGNNFSAATTDSGEVYTWGEQGIKLGHNNTISNELVPRLVTNLNKFMVISVDVGHAHSAAIISSQSPLSRDLKILLNDNEFYDITLVVEGEEIRAHKFILAARSPVFRKQLMDDRDLTEIVIPETKGSYEGYSAMMRYIYTDHPGDIPPRISPELELIAKEYELGRLQDIANAIKQKHIKFSRDTLFVRLPSLAKDLEMAYKEDNFFTDTSFMLDGIKRPSHRAMLYARSAYFRTMMDSKMSESERDGTIFVEDVHPIVFEAVKEYFYTNSTHLSADYIIEMFITANVWRMTGLKQMCESFIAENIELESVLPILDVATFYKSSVLNTACKDFLSTKFLEDVTKLEYWEDVSEELRKVIEDVCKKNDSLKFRSNKVAYRDILFSSRDLEEDWEGEYNDYKVDDEFGYGPVSVHDLKSSTDDIRVDANDYFAKQERKEQFRKLRLALAKARMDMGINLGQFSALVGIDQDQVTKIERGFIEPTRDFVALVEKATKKSFMSMYPGN